MSISLRTLTSEVGSVKEVGSLKIGRSRRANSALLLAASLLAFGLAGCGADRPIKYYQLTYPPAPPVSQEPLNVSILVRTFDAVHLFKEDRIVYGFSANEMGTYESSRWVAPPVELLQTALARGLRTAGHFRTVLNVRGEGGGDYALSGYLYEFGEVDGAQIVARLHYVVRMRDRKTGAVLWNHTYLYDEPVPAKTIPAVVAAMDKNVQRSVQEINDGLVAYFQTNPPK